MTYHWCPFPRLRRHVKRIVRSWAATPLGLFVNLEKGASFSRKEYFTLRIWHNKLYLCRIWPLLSAHFFPHTGLPWLWRETFCRAHGHQNLWYVRDRGCVVPTYPSSNPAARSAKYVVSFHTSPSTLHVATSLRERVLFSGLSLVALPCIVCYNASSSFYISWSLIIGLFSCLWWLFADAWGGGRAELLRILTSRIGF